MIPQPALIQLTEVRAFAKGTEDLHTARLLKDTLGENVIKQHIISHTESISDMLEQAIMLKEYGLLDSEKARVQVVPLFETVEDLQTPGKS